MLQKLVQFRNAEAGAVTIDWVVLVAALMLLSTVITYSVYGGTMTLTYTINENLGSVEPGLSSN
ncbi:MAG: hypothetical protein V3S12_04945 [Acidiferrobacterales bacterium]